jgi:hypothetical protein
MGAKVSLGIRIIRKVRQLGGENGQFWHNRASNAKLEIKFSQHEITGTQASFGWYTEFHPVFPFS